MKTALLLDDNLLSSGRIESQLRRAGFETTLARKVPEDSDFSVVLLNLGSRPLNGLQLIGPVQDRFPTAKFAGFCGHLVIEIRRAAKAAGLERILTNEEAMSQLDVWLEAVDE